MSVPRLGRELGASVHSPIEVPDVPEVIPEAYKQPAEEMIPLPSLDSHENAALVSLPPLSFSLQPLHAMDISPKQRLDWSHELYQSLPACEPVTVTYCRTRQESEVAARRLWENERLLGFDMEWKPSYTKATVKEAPRPPTIRDIKENASLIQLACESEVVIFHIAAHTGHSNRELVAPSLRKLLESPAVTKTGVAIMNADGVRLQKYLGIKPRGMFELSHMYKLVKYGGTPQTVPLVDKRLVALKKQVEEHLGLPLAKGKVRISNWSKPIALTPQQIKYAAADAYAGYMLFRIMDNKRKAMVPRPAIPAHAERNLPILAAIAPARAPTITPTDNAATDSRAKSHDKGQVKKTPVAEDETDEGYHESVDLSNTCKKPRIAHTEIQTNTPEPKPLESSAVSEPHRTLPQRGNLCHETEVPQLAQTSATNPPASKRTLSEADRPLPQYKTYNSADRTMRQVFSALRGLIIQLAMKFGIKAEAIGPDGLLQYLSASRPNSIKAIDEQFISLSENLIHYCNLAGKDLFEFIKRYTPDISAVSTVAPASSGVTMTYRPKVDVSNAHESQSDQSDTVASLSTSTSLLREIKRKRTPLVSLDNLSQQPAIASPSLISEGPN